MVAEGGDLMEGGEGEMAGDEVFGLEFCAGGGGEFQAEVGEPLVPGAGEAELRGAVFGGDAGDGVEGGGGGRGAEESFWEDGGTEVVCAVLEPDLVDVVGLVGGEEADAVGGGEDGFEVLDEPGRWGGSGRHTGRW